ncbi:MAG: HAMP domain-containing histidine kinase [Chitinophagaceae bacterium]|nr:HAMP domain-containing histidine kinase [Chitinophagaceae bacterium]
MNRLLHKTLKTYSIFALFVLAASVPAYYFLTDHIWLRELDEHNEIIAQRTEKELNKLQLSELQLSQSLALWNSLKPGTYLKPLTVIKERPDSFYTVLRPNPYSEKPSIDRFRGLSKIIHINGKPFELFAETNVEETEETVAAIAVLTFLFFLILVAGLLFLTRRLSAQLWKPFRNTLAKLKNFRLNSATPLVFEQSDTAEFEELNNALRKLIAQNISAYKAQKEFTENASHELQTPLAIIKNKLDLLLQKESLTERQYQLIEEINKSLTRITGINRNLLLLAKIENHQFDDMSDVNVSTIVEQCSELSGDFFEQKNLHLQTTVETNVIISSNATLVEILVNNLLMNAYRHTVHNGHISIQLNKAKLSVYNSGKQALDSRIIFERFSKKTGEHTGTGLGLAIIKEICVRHKWDINYQFKNEQHCFSVIF